MASTPKAENHVPLVIERSGHCISRSNISKSALKVLYRLKDAGYQAFLVGGGVRDLLLGLHPKDFDIATDAHPEEVRSLFKNSRLIGRRFRLAHVRFGREVIEVATFRKSSDGSEAGVQSEAQHTQRIVRDNEYGCIEEDIWRRDFTVNALYYNIADYSIWDFCSGMTDMKDRTLRLIGEPERRFREDPVRMLRAARLAAKLNFSIHEDTARQIPVLADLLDGAPPARLFDEFLKIFQTGHALDSYERLVCHGLFEHLFPQTARWLEAAPDDRRAQMIRQALNNTDQRVANGKSVTPMFLFAVFLWGPVRERASELVERENQSEYQALMIAANEVTVEQVTRISLPKRFSYPMREMLQMQPRFLKLKGSRAMNFLEHKRFRAAYDLMLLRASAGELDQEVADWWTEVQTLSEPEKLAEFGLSPREKDPAATKHRSRRRRRPRQEKH